MSKFQTSKIILISIAISFLLNLFFGRFLTAKISTLPLLNRLKLINPQAPIIINTKEEIRISDSGDVLQALGAIKSKISTLLVVNGSQVAVSGAVVNLTSDGLFLATKAVVGDNQSENFLVKLDDGTLVKVVKLIPDAATDLVVLRTQANNLPVVDLGESKKLIVGEKIISVYGSWLDFSPGASVFYVSNGQNDDFGSVKSADFPGRAFAVQNQNQLLSGSVLVNLSGAVVGLVDDRGRIISSDVMKNFVRRFLSNNGQIIDVSFGFKCRNLSSSEAKLFQLPFGCKVSDIIPLGAAQKAGLSLNDVITEVDGKAIISDLSLEELLGNYNPKDMINFTIFRNKQNLTLTLTVSEL
jgi:S1-C subfamily serine protease